MSYIAVEEMEYGIYPHHANMQKYFHGAKYWILTMLKKIPGDLIF